MTTEETLGRLKAILGKGLYPTALPAIKEILRRLEEESFKAGLEQAGEIGGYWLQVEATILLNVERRKRDG